MGKDREGVFGTLVFVLGTLCAFGVVVYDVFQWLLSDVWEFTVLADVSPAIAQFCATAPSDWIQLWQAACWVAGDLPLAILVFGLACAVGLFR